MDNDVLFSSKDGFIPFATFQEKAVSFFPPIEELKQIIQVQKQQLLVFAQQICFQKHQLSLRLQQIKTLHIHQEQQLDQNEKEINQYKDLLLKDMASEFVNSFDSPKTRSTYSEGLSELFLQGFLQPEMKLIEFSRLSGENLLDDVRKNYKMKNRKGQYDNASESTKQLRAAMLLAFSSFLQRRTEGFIQKISPNRYGFNKTFRPRRQKTIASHLIVEQLNLFLKQLKTNTSKGFLFAALQILGAKRVSEVIQLRVEEVDIKNSRVLFRNLKQREFIREPVPIYIPSTICEELQSYIGQRKEGFVFLIFLNTYLQKVKHSQSF